MNPSSTSRKRTNLMIKIALLEQMDLLLSAGERSNFVNEALEEKLADLSRSKALERMDASIKKQKKIHTTKEILKILHADRRH